MSPPVSKGSVEADVKRQASARKQPKPAEPKIPKYHWWNAPKITLNPRMQGVTLVPPPPINPPEPARPSHGLSDEDRSRRDDNGLGRAPTTPRQQRSIGTQTYSQRSVGTQTYSQRETEGLNRGFGDEGRSRHDDHSQRGSKKESRR